MNVSRPQAEGVQVKKRPAYDYKSGILAVLVSISIFLTGSIWLGVAGRTSVEDPLDIRRSNPADAGLPSLLAPRLLLIHNAGDQHLGLPAGTEGYAKLWDNGNLIKRVLAATSGRRDSVAATEIRQARADYALEFVLTDGYRLSDLAQVYGTTAPDVDATVDRLIVSYSKSPALYARTFPDGGYVSLTIRTEALPTMDSLKGLSSPGAKRYVELAQEIEGIPIASGTYVPRSTEPLAPMSVQRDPSGASGVLSTFFLDVSLLRKIEERDGALIYSDGRRGVRIYPSGAMDYSQPAPGGTATAKLQSIEKAALFALEHGGLPGTAYVDRTTSFSSTTHEGSRVRFNFRYAGMPIIGTRGVIEILVSSSGAEEFLRNFRAPTGNTGEEKAVISPREAITVISVQMARLFGDASPRAVTNVELAYLNNSPEEFVELLDPVWHVEFESGWAVAVGAHDGNVTVTRRVQP